MVSDASQCRMSPSASYLGSRLTRYTTDSSDTSAEKLATSTVSVAPSSPTDTPLPTDSSSPVVPSRRDWSIRPATLATTCPSASAANVTFPSEFDRLKCAEGRLLSSAPASCQLLVMSTDSRPTRRFTTSSERFVSFTW